MSFNPVLTCMALHRCGEVGEKSSALRDEFVSYDLQSGEVVSLKAEIVQSDKWMRGCHLVQTYFTCRNVGLSSCQRSGGGFKRDWRDYDNYRSMAEDSDEDGKRETAEAVSLGAKMENDLL